MKRLITFCLLVSFSFAAFGQGRLIESSASNPPKWLKRDVNQYDLIKASAISTVNLEDAKEQAILQLKNYVILSTTRYMLKTTINGDAEAIKSKVEKSRAVKNIGEYSALETYWEIRYVKKKTLYYYYILFNYNEFEMKKIAVDVNKEGSSSLEELNKL